MKLPKMFETFRLEKQKGEYKDFGVASSSTYPLKGVTYPVDYGDIAGYRGEDGADLDVFLGTVGELCGFIIVSRPELPNGEHKFYVNLTDQEEAAVLKEFSPVVVKHCRFQNTDELVEAIESFKVEVG